MSNLTTGRIAAAHGRFGGIARWRHGESDVVSLYYSSARQQDSDNTDIFSNQMIQFHSNNAINLHHRNLIHAVRRVAAQHRDRIVTTDYGDVSSSCVLAIFTDAPYCLWAWQR